MQGLLDIFRKIGELPPSQETALLEAVVRKEYPAKTILLQQGQICHKIYYVEKGIARTYYLKDGKDITYWLALENDFVGSMSSFFMREPSNKFVATVSDCVLWEFEHQRLEELYASNTALEKVGRQFANHAISLMEKRFEHLHFNTAKERYNQLIATEPAIIQRVPLGMIASYLGVSQETLSRIRSSK